MQIRCYADQDLTVSTRAAIARYRHEVFVTQMGWALPCEPGFEQDEFDTAGATHVVAYDDEDARIIGYGRLLPTTQPYLLARHFAGLLNGAQPPATAEVWELSRYTAADPQGKAQDANVGKRLLLAAVRFAAARGGQSLVCCTTVAIERLANRWGVPMRRLGPPQRMDGFLLIAAQIRFTTQTYEALVPAEREAERHEQAWMHPALPVLVSGLCVPARVRAVQSAALA
jgi:acyl homoserine lactone synthase